MECCGRRQVLAASGVVASSLFITGCGESDDDDGSAEPASTASDAPATSSEGEGSGAGAESIASVGDVPVGGGVVVQSEQVVITQPTDGEFKAFSAVCPHQGCLVTDVRDGEIVCPCHGSRFSVDTGDVLGGPAPRGLDERQATVTGDGIAVS